MIENAILIKEEDWGLHLTFREGVKVDNNNILPIIKEVVAEAKNKGKNRLLINALSIQREVSLVNLFQAGQTLLQLKTVGFRIAFVAPHLSGNEESRFMENVGYNRGTMIKYFSDTDKALSWLSG